MTTRAGAPSRISPGARSSRTRCGASSGGAAPGSSASSRHTWRRGSSPTTPEDRALGDAASACVACGLCEPGCDLAAAAPAVRALGLHATFRLYSRSAGGLPLAAGALAACEGCTGCDALCPTGVPISAIVRRLRAKAAAEIAARGTGQSG